MTEPMRSEALPGPSRVRRVGEVLDEVVSGGLSRGMSAAQRAAVAWAACNGDRERAHTTRVFLRAPRVEGADPVIWVYVDSHAFLTDLTANRDIYLARLANWGFAVSGIEFAVDREAHGRVRGACVVGAAEGRPDVGDAPTDEERARAEELAGSLPAALRPSVSKAIAATLHAADGN